MDKSTQHRRTPEGKRERNKAGNRAAILTAARRVFSDLGYEAATVRDVIGATDLAAGTFYNYFRDKEQVLRALLDEKMGELQARARDARRDAATVEDIVRSTLSVSFAVLAEDREVFDILRRNAGAIRAILDEPSFIANRDDLRRDLERAARRSGASTVDPEYLTAAISGVAFEVAACAVDRRPHAMQEAAAFATTLVLGGLAALSSGSAGVAPSRGRTAVAAKRRKAAAASGRPRTQAKAGSARKPTRKKAAGPTDRAAKRNPETTR